MKCPNCGSEDCQIISETSSTGKDFEASGACLGSLLLGPLGLLCGACGPGRQINTEHFWVCKKCGSKWKA